jgi:ubiquinone/menaquinone biosynthesis C-methylase UbiE
MKVFSWFYFRLIVKPLGNLLIPKKLPAYRYLIDSIEAFHSAAQMRQLFQDVGFRDVHTIRFNLGTVALTVGTK